MLYKLGDLLVEFYNIGFLVNELLDKAPFWELRVGDLPLCSSSECADEAAEKLSCQESL